MIEKLLALIESESGVKATPETLLLDLGLDSLEFMDFILQVQQSFGVEISDAKIAELNTVADLANAISG